MKKISSLLILFLLIGFDSVQVLAESALFHIDVIRMRGANGIVHGEILVNMERIGVTYERKDKHIMPGTYNGTLRYVSPTSPQGNVIGPFGYIGRTGDFYLNIGSQKYSDGSYGRNAMFHGGDRPEHSDGCIMLGVVPRDGKGKRYVPSSHTLAKLRRAFYGTENPIVTPHKRIIIHIHPLPAPKKAIRENHG